MFKGTKKYLYLFLVLFALIVGVQYLLPKPINWSRTYLNKDKAPFGCYAIFNLLENVYSKNITYNNQTFYNLKDKLDSTASLLLINENFNFNKNDLKSLYKILENGSTVLLAANAFDGPLSDSLHLTTEYNSSDFYSPIDSLMAKQGVRIKLKAKNFKSKEYSYTKVANSSYFSNFDTTRFTALATDENNNACLIKTKIGKGDLLLLSNPDIFGNYFIVKNKNRELVYAILSILQNKNLVWDEYYKTYKTTNSSFLKFIIESDALYSAYILLFFTLIIYMFTEGRRRQRAIAVKELVTNSTLEFVDVISHVYFNSKNHKSIAVERIKYFYETIRKKFNVKTTEINNSFINEICELSGLENKLVTQLFNYCEKIKTLNDISEYDLIELNRQITNFNKNSLR